MIKRYWVNPKYTQPVLPDIEPMTGIIELVVRYDDHLEETTKLKDSLIVWHKVEDELPDEKYDGEIVVKWKLSPECGWHYDITGSGYIRAHPTVITYWAYLPKPPKE